MMNDRYAYDRWLEREPEEGLYEDVPEKEETMDRQLIGNIYISDDVRTQGEECDACNPGADADGRRQGIPAVYRLYIKGSNMNWGAGKFCHNCLYGITLSLTAVLEETPLELTSREA